jgi:2'-5' RNA ligase
VNLAAHADSYDNAGMRLFIAIPLAEKVKEELASVAARLHSADDGLRWSSPESWHITLQFLGNVATPQYECIGPQLRNLHSPPVSIQLEGLSCFSRVGVLIARITPAPGLLLLQQRVAESMDHCGFVPESRPYQPHITLARSKGKPSATCLRNLESRADGKDRFTAFTAKEFLLYESFLGAPGSRYEIRQHFLLR